MTLKYRRKQPLTRKIVKKQAARLIVIATEDSNTEPEYFDGMFGSNKKPRVILEVLETQKGFSAPNHLLERLDDVISDEDLKLDSGDELWLVFDKDDWPWEKINKVVRDAKRRGIHVAISNPCFEVWLILHIQSFPASGCNTSKKCKRHLKNIGGSRSNGDLILANLEPGINNAIKKAIALDINTSSVVPNEPGTRLYNLIESINR